MKFSIFEKYPELWYGFSERSDGGMKWFSDEALWKESLENRKKYFGKLGLPADRVVTTDIVHGIETHVAGDDDAGNVIPKTDALITTTKNLFLTITGADCFPIYCYDPESGIVGIAHAGWRGITAGVVSSIIQKFPDPQNILVGIGPGIRVCHFDIDPANAGLYENYPGAVRTKDDKTFVDLVFVIKEQLAASGVRDEHVEDSTVCTSCDAQTYFSYRRDNPTNVQAMIAHIGLPILGVFLLSGKDDRGYAEVR